MEEQGMPEAMKDALAKIAFQVARRVVEECLMREGSHVLLMAFREHEGKGICVGGMTVKDWEGLAASPEDSQIVVKRMAEMLMAGEMESYGKSGQA